VFFLTLSLGCTLLHTLKPYLRPRFLSPVTKWYVRSVLTQFFSHTDMDLFCRTTGCFQVTLTGSDFGTSGRVQVDQMDAIVESYDHHRIIFRSPLGSLGDHTVVVMADAELGSVFSNTKAYTNESPQVISLRSAFSTTGELPSTGGLLTIVGQHFGSDSDLPLDILNVTIEGTACGDITRPVNDSELVCVVPPGVGANRAVIVSTSGVPSNADVVFSYFGPVISNVSGCADQNPNKPSATLGCRDGDTLTIRGSNFGPLVSSWTITVDGSPCALLLFVPHYEIHCRVPPGNGVDRPIVMALSGFPTVSVSARLMSYRGPFIETATLKLADDPDPPQGDANTVKAASNGPQWVSFRGRSFGDDPTKVTVHYGWFNAFENSWLFPPKPCLLDPDAFTTNLIKCQTQGELVGAGLRFQVNITSDGATSLSNIGLDTLCGPVPLINSSTIQLPEASAAQESAKKALGELSSNELVRFRGLHFGSDKTLVRVHYGPNFELEAFVEAVNDTSIECRTVLSVGEDLVFRVTLGPSNFASLGSRPPDDTWTVSSQKGTDTYSYPLSPVIDSVTGCSGPQADGNTTTTGCPTNGRTGSGIYAGPQRITLTGKNFGIFGATVSVGKGSCRSVIHTKSGTEVTCVLPRGVGLKLPVQMFRSIYSSPPVNYVSYTPPTIQSVTGCSDQNVTTVDCPRAGQVLITIRGYGFGDAASVSVSGAVCSDVLHTLGAEDYELQCRLPALLPGELPLNRIVTVYQRNGELSDPGGVLSYIVCPLGTYSTECVKCPAGKYARISEQSSCQDCGPGTFSAEIGSSECEQCSTGFYNDALGQTSCRICANGTVAAGVAASLCDACAPGKFAALPGRQECTLCAVGRSQATAGKSFCRICPPGNMAKQAGSTECRACSAGSYGPVEEASSCVQCEPGKSANSSSATMCADCELGHIAPIAGLLLCTACPVGSFARKAASTTCALCDASTFQSAEARSSCEPCTAGKYSPVPGAASCSLCSIGRFSLGPVTTCPMCPKGTFGASRGISACSACLSGRFSDQVASSSCSSCSAGRAAQQNHSVVCQVCPAGSFSDTNGPLRVGASTCSLCSPGKHSPFAEGDVCLDCFFGEFAPLAGLSFCTQCEPGRFSDATGASVCARCPHGMGSDAAAISCTVCLVGRFSDDSELNCRECTQGKFQPDTGQTACAHCPIGSSTDEYGATACLRCATGHIAASPGSTECIECGPGTIPSILSGAPDACVGCPLGFYNPSTAAEYCEPCVSGSYTNMTGSSMCKLCAAGTFNVHNGNSHCSDCPPGFSSQEGEACQACNPGSFAAFNATFPCAICTLGTVQPNFGRTACMNCTAGSFMGNIGQERCHKCLAGSFSASEARSSCQQCSVGTFQSLTGESLCTTCSPGSVAATPGSVECDDCSPGRFSNPDLNDECSPCQPGSFQSHALSTGCQRCPEGTFARAISASTCLYCAQGSFGGSGAMSSCDLCAPGAFSAGLGSTTCEDCPTGYVSSAAGSSTCQECRPGTYNGLPAGIECLSCIRGTFQADSGESSCQLCANGFEAPAKKSTACTVCTAGRYSTSGTSSCRACQSGHFQPTQGSSECLECSPGKFSTQGSPQCTQCPNRLVAPDPGSEACIACHRDAFNDGAFVKCECQPGFMDQYSAEDWALLETMSNHTQQREQRVQLTKADCSPCPPGADCGRQGALQSALLTQAGWWRSSNSTMTFWACPQITFCPGGKGAGDDQCLGHRAGPMCSLCEPDHHKLSDNTCGPCPENESKSMQKAVAAFCGLLIGTTMLLVAALFKDKGLVHDMSNKNRALAAAKTSNSSIEQHTASGLDVKKASQQRLKLVISFLQMATAVALNTNLHWPPLFLAVMGWLRLVNLNVMPWSAVSCVVKVDFYTRYVIMLIFPFVVIGTLALVLLARGLTKKPLKGLNVIPYGMSKLRFSLLQLKKVAFIVIFLVYPRISSTCMGMFLCEKIDGSWFMKGDFSTPCFDSRWYDFLPVNIVLLVLVPLGVPALFLYSVYRSRDRLNQPEVQYTHGFMYKSFRMEMWWFEVVTLLLKLTMTSLVPFFGTVHQLRAGIVILFVFFLLVLFFKPYFEVKNEQLQLLTIASLFTINFGGLLLNEGEEYTPLADLTVALFMLATMVGVFSVACQEAYSILLLNIASVRELCKKRFQDSDVGLRGLVEEDSGVEMVSNPTWKSKGGEEKHGNRNKKRPSKMVSAHKTTVALACTVVGLLFVPDAHARKFSVLTVLDFERFCLTLSSLPLIVA
jgi:hypothetical protein